ncbi:MAG: TolB family protein, partial [Bdellovibrionota bacterium]
GLYHFFRAIFGSWVKPNGLEPGWLAEGLAVFEETQHTTGGRGRSPLLEAILRTAVREEMLTSRSYTSLDRFNDGNQWWPSGNMAYLLGYTIQALPTKEKSGFPGLVARANAGNFPFSPNDAIDETIGKDWYDVWAIAPYNLQKRYGKPAAFRAECKLTNSGNFTGGQALSADGWIDFSELDFERHQHFARVRADAPCDTAEIERLYHKDETGPTQVAVSPTGKFAAFAAFDRQGLDRIFSDVYLWQNEIKETKRLTDGARVRDPAFASDSVLLYVKKKPDTSDAIIRRDLTNDSEKEIFLSKPLERISGLFARGDQVLFSLHQNNGQERIQSLSLASGKYARAFPGIDAKIAHERNPYLDADGSIYFSASYNFGTQDLFRYDPKAKKFRKIADSDSGFLDRPIPLPDGKNILYSSYGLNGLDIVRAPIKDEPPVARVAAEDLHEFLTGSKPEPVETSSEEATDIPYSAFSTPATSLWPQYWLPDIVAAKDGALIGASTSGNDPLEYHKYGITAQYDTRTKFPTYLAYYQNRSNLVNLYLQANQLNDYFVGSKTSNRSATYSAQAIVPVNEAAYSFGGAFQERSFFGARGQNTIVFQNFNHTEFGKSAAAIAPNFGHLVNLYLGLYPSSRNENFFADVRPSLALYARGFSPSHSISFLAQAGISTNSILASNYYQGGGASPLSTSGFVVRGYPTDVLLGQRVATANLAYTMPLFQLYRGLGTGPVFFEKLGLRFMGDIGSANYIGRYIGGNFLGYKPTKYMRTGIAGTGADLLLTGSLFYHVPVTLISGLHYGFAKKFGGELLYMFGLNVGSIGTSPDRPTVSGTGTGPQ